MDCETIHSKKIFKTKDLLKVSCSRNFQISLTNSSRTTLGFNLFFTLNKAVALQHMYPIQGGEELNQIFVTKDLYKQDLLNNNNIFDKEAKKGQKLK